MAETIPIKKSRGEGTTMKPMSRTEVDDWFFFRLPIASVTMR